MYTNKIALLLVLLAPCFVLVSSSCGCSITQSRRSFWTAADQTTSSSNSVPIAIFDVTITNTEDSPILSLVINTQDTLQQYWNMVPVLEGLTVPSYVTAFGGLAVGSSFEWGYIIDSATEATFTIQDISCSSSSGSGQPTIPPPFPTQNPTSPPPSSSPTQSPSNQPTGSPSQAPSSSPTQAPHPGTQSPTQSPSQAPSQSPSSAPSQSPSRAPTSPPQPTQIPATQAPTQAPSQAPTNAPSRAPTQAPTNAPSQAPTNAPSRAPTQAPAATSAPTQPSGGGGASINSGWVDVEASMGYPSAPPQNPLYTGHYPSSGFCTGVPKQYNGKLCATTTRYFDGQMGACGCGTGDSNPFPFQWQTYTAAASPPIYGYNSWCGRGCGKCFNITTTGYSPNGKGAPPGQSIVVTVTNLCPPQDPWCADGLTSFNYLGHFDLMDENMNGIISALGWDNPEVYFEEIDCTGEMPNSTPPSSIAQCQCH